MSYPASERFLPESQTHPHLTGSLFAPLPDVNTQESTNRSLSSSVQVELKGMWGDKLLTVVRSRENTSLRSPWVAQPDSVPFSALTSTYRPVLIKSTPMGRLPNGPGGLSQLRGHSLAQHRSK